MAIKLTVKEGGRERNWDVVDGQQIDVHMTQDAQFSLIDTRTGQTPDGLRIARHDGQIDIYGSDSYPWVTLHHGDAAAPPQAVEAGEAAAAPPAQEFPAPLPQEVVPQETLPVEHLRAEEVAAEPAAEYSGGDVETPSMGSMLLAGGGALVIGGVAALISGNSSNDYDGLPHGRPTDNPRQHGGGQGYTLQLNNETLDVARVAQDGKLDLDNGHNDLLKLSARDLLGDPAATLTIDGNRGDTVQLAGNHWTQLADEGNYHVYRHNNLIARIEDDIGVAMV